MKIVIAPDSFKGSLSAKEVAENIKAGIERVYKDIDIQCVPMADGGEGTVQSLVDATSGEIVNARVKGPLLQEVDAFYGILGDGKTAVIEMAAASGLPLVPEEKRNPMITTTYGTGELIRHALDMGCREIIIGIGGSATNDGGIGMAQALGVKFLDRDGNSAAVYASICKQAEVPVQYFVNRSDEVGGSTIGPISASHLEMRCVDMGTPVLAMHSVRELCGVMDHTYVAKSFVKFYEI